MEKNKPGRKAGEVMCEVLIEQAQKNKDILVLTSDSRGSASLKPYAEKFPEQIIEVGIAEQNLVGISAGLASSGRRPFAVSPAAFLTMRSIEQVKVDVSYSNTNVKLVGISGGNSYSDLGMSHHSLQDLAITRAIPNLEIFMPCDQFQTRKMFEYLAQSDKPAYIRIGKQVLKDCYDENIEFVPGKANVLKEGKDTAIIGSGETLNIAMEAAEWLEKDGISAKVIDMHTIKPLDDELIDEISQEYQQIFSIEEHSIFGGLGSAVSERVAQGGKAKLKIFGFPDEPAISGKQMEVFDYYGLTGEKIANEIKKILNS